MFPKKTVLSDSLPRDLTEQMKTERSEDSFQLANRSTHIFQQDNNPIWKPES